MGRNYDDFDIASERAARREARIKKILGNSKNRLSKIAGTEENTNEGVSNFHNETEADRIIYPDPEIERDVYEYGPSFTSMMGRSQAEPDIFQLLNNLGPPQAKEQPTSTPAATTQATKMTRFLRTKIHFALLAVLTYVAVATNTLIFRNIFLMFLLWEAAEVFLLKTYEVNKTSYLSILFMMGGLPAIHSTAIIKFIETSVKILNDVAVFVFYFIVSHILWKIFVLGSTFESITNLDAIQTVL